MLRGFTQRQLAGLAGLDRVSILRYETGKLEASLRICAQIAEALQIEPDLLYDNYLKFISDDECGSRIRAVRLNQRLTQTQFAQKIGVAKKTVGFWERGQSAPSREHYLQIFSCAE